MRTVIDIPAASSPRYVAHALEGLARVAAEQIAENELPPLYRSGVRYEREPRGSEEWLTPLQMLERGVADCEDLAAYRVGELRASGADPGAVVTIVRTGPRTLHAVVRRSDGSIEDPSRVLGMTSTSHGVTLPRLTVGVERGEDGSPVSWYEVSRRAPRGRITQAPTLAEAFATTETAGPGEVGFVGPVLDTVARAAQGAIQAVVPGMAPQAAARAPARSSAPVAVRVAPARVQAAASQLQREGLPVSASDILSVASQLARVVKAEVHRDRAERRRRPAPAGW